MHPALAGLSPGVSPLVSALSPDQAAPFALCSFAALLSASLAGTLLGWWLRGR